MLEGSRDLRLELVPVSLEFTRSSKHNTKRFYLSLFFADKSYFFAARAKKAIPRSVLLRASYHSRGMDTNAGAKVSTPLELSPFPLPAPDLRSAPPSAPNSLCSL